MDRGNGKHGPRLDDNMKQDTEGLVRGGHSTHAEEWKDPEPMDDSGERGFGAPNRPPGHEPGSPPGMSRDDVERRSNVARYLGRADFPADKEGLLRHLEEHNAPDNIAAAVRKLPDGTYHQISEVADALGIHQEKRRT
ncbi:DUF2795 domain-containing protein [Bailinhaonella thermotolerans]|uniref:DUF2795 domain-containing protein n=1 Tax=Bailinhaonella thermotolerans TaxID=1070861 RepID=A0A3A4A4M3_9ACTN|nr:DUF2795 domain-containing protein [Bailinhaonella thermotolerans]RJL22741.1 DUF2795 domain-containing protein [Bailinhaonella thermotolerans]